MMKEFKQTKWTMNRTSKTKTETRIVGNESKKLETSAAAVAAPPTNVY